METVDVLVVGAGLAGLHTARLLAGQGHDLLVVDRRRTLAAGIRTTGIFVRRTLEDFALPAEHLGPAIRRVRLYPPSLRRPVELVSSRDEFRVADMAGVYAHALARARLAGARVRLGVSYPVAGVAARFTVGADGARSTVARRLGLDVNRHVIVGVEEVFPVAGGGRPPTFHCVVDPRLAPGYLGWVVDDGRHAHVGPSELAAAVTGDYLRTGDVSVLRHYDGAALRARFRARLLPRRAFSGVRSPAAAEAAFTLLRTPPGRAAAARVLFGDGSFPDASRPGRC